MEEFYAAITFEGNHPPVFYNQVEARSLKEAKSKVMDFRQGVHPSMGLGHLGFEVHISCDPFPKVGRYISFKETAGY
jgi:hypothetical protein